MAISRAGAHLLGLDTPMQSKSINLLQPARFVARLVSLTSYHRVDVTGGVLLNLAPLDLTVEFQPAAGATFTIIDNDGNDLVRIFRRLARRRDCDCEWP